MNEQESFTSGLERRGRSDRNLDETVRAIAAELLEEYQCPFHTHPWIIGFSGGKDSTLVTQLVIEMLLRLAPWDRRRSVHIVANDTLVESPIVMGNLLKILDKLRSAVETLRVPVTVATTKPPVDQTFFVNCIGRGYRPPTRNFRWCTDRMKIQPTSEYIRRQVAASGSVILLLGVRSAESGLRASNILQTTANRQRLWPHPVIPNCLMYRPIVDLTDHEVWQRLLLRPAPWGGRHRDLIELYRGAQGAECPTVIEGADRPPACGASSPRFGCWTCTVVKRDRSMEALVDHGFEQYAPLVEFRIWLADLAEDMTRRLPRQRPPIFRPNGSLIAGKFTIPARMEIFDRLLKVQEQVGFELISLEERDLIRKLWCEELLTISTQRVPENTAGTLTTDPEDPFEP